MEPLLETDVLKLCCQVRPRDDAHINGDGINEDVRISK